jgi:hypothetical protein
MLARPPAAHCGPPAWRWHPSFFGMGLTKGLLSICRPGAATSCPFPSPTCWIRPTGRTRVRRVDIHSTRYAIARRYMIRLRRDDFEDPAAVAALAEVAI